MLYTILNGFSCWFWKSHWHNHVTYHIWNMVMLYTKTYLLYFCHHSTDNIIIWNMSSSRHTSCVFAIVVQIISLSEIWHCPDIPLVFCHHCTDNIIMWDMASSRHTSCIFASMVQRISLCETWHHQKLIQVNTGSQNGLHVDLE